MEFQFILKRVREGPSRLKEGELGIFPVSVLESWFAAPGCLIKKNMQTNNCKKSNFLKEAEQKFNEWFFSEEGEIVAKPHSNAGGQYGTLMTKQLV